MAASSRRWTRVIRRAWSRRGIGGWCLWGLLWPGSMIFRLLVGLRNVLYDIRCLNARKLALPVVSVGNLTVGGTGKTPTTLWLAQNLRRRGLNAAILTRGYGGPSKGRPPGRIDPENRARVAEGGRGRTPRLRRRAGHAERPVRANRGGSAATVIEPPWSSARNPETSTSFCWMTVSSTVGWRGMWICSSSVPTTAARWLPAGALPGAPPRRAAGRHPGGHRGPRPMAGPAPRPLRRRQGLLRRSRTSGGPHPHGRGADRTDPRHPGGRAGCWRFRLLPTRGPSMP